MTLSPGFEHDVQQLWHRFLQRIEPVRPDLHRYCRALTRSVWDAEDLLQETLLRAFATLGDVSASIDSPKAYMLRIASNLWIDRVRRTQDIIAAACEESESDPQDALLVRDAAKRLIRLLSPQERAAVVLKDVFDFQLAEIAKILETTVGAVKSALHDGRQKLSAPESARAPGRVSEQIVDRFVELFNARDFDRLAKLLREEVKVEVVGMGHWLGVATVCNGPLHYTMVLEKGDPRAERCILTGEPLVLIWYAMDDEPTRKVRNVMRLEASGAQISSLRFYTLCPETLSEIAHLLKVPMQSNGYGPWSPELIAMRKQAEYQDWIARRAK
jgi:RNA polymerase sigma-70 factor, ECF subfamily